jgi:hypothetical protein
MTTTATATAATAALLHDRRSARRRISERDSTGVCDVAVLMAAR